MVRRHYRGFRGNKQEHEKKPFDVLNELEKIKWYLYESNEMSRR